mmetsp:Transcript_37375/g.101201  ORF Transcript_37375/g.101201 Transcript_37375/m.101201 type:complete len:239 (-) Transcript_37375:221-937(-)
MYDDVSPNATFDCSLIHDTYSREYCEIDRYEACAVESNCPIEDGECSADAQLQLISFAKCLEWDDGCDDPASAPPCLDEAGMDTAAVTDCATGPDNGAAAIMNSIYAVANASTPVVTMPTPERSRTCAASSNRSQRRTVCGHDSCCCCSRGRRQVRRPHAHQTQIHGALLPLVSTNQTISRGGEQSGRLFSVLLLSYKCRHASGRSADADADADAAPTTHTPPELPHRPWLGGAGGAR